MQDEDQKNYSGGVVVLVPASDDPIVAASSEPAHLTLVFLGEDASQVDGESLLQQVKAYAAKLTPVTVPVASRGTLGADNADVVFLEKTDSIVAVRQGLMEGAVKEAHDGVEQFPSWNPHVTLGYPETPAEGEYDGTEVRFDAIGLWLGGVREDFPLTGDDSISAGASFDLAQVLVEDDEDEMPYDEPEDGEEEITEIPVHGVLAVEGLPTGDSRMFEPGSVSARDLPIPLRYEIYGSHGGDTSVVVTVGRVDKVWRVGKDIRWSGVISMFAKHAPGVLQGLMDRTVRGVSIDGDDATASLNDEGVTVFSAIRTAGLTIVPIPAYQECYIALGEGFQEDLTDEQKAEQDAILADCGCGDSFSSDTPGLRKDGTPPKCEYCDAEATQYVLHSEGMAYIPACEAHLDDAKADAAKSTPSGAPDEKNIDRIESYSLTAGASFAPGTKDGPGWITHPVPTSRIRRYWTQGKGAAKIRWGAGGDFYRCRNQLRKYVQNPDWLAGMCANMHKEATGMWPGEHDVASATVVASAAAPSVRMVGEEFAPEVELAGLDALTAAAGYATKVYPHEWFTSPKLTQPTPLTVDPETGRVFGHLAVWGTCHVGIPGVCTTPPHTSTDYRAFKGGVVDTDAGPLRVGKLTAGVGHPSPRMRAAAATAHYDKPEAVRAFVNVGEDSVGIWYSGVLAPWLSQKEVDQFRMVGTLSGDWRSFGRGLELVGAVSVSQPGFPVVPDFAIERGQQVALIAGGSFTVEEETAEEITARIGRAAVQAYVAKMERLTAVKAQLRPYRLAALRGKIEKES